MNNPSFKELLYCYSLDTWQDSEAEEVTSLVSYVYQGFFGHELERNSGKTLEVLKVLLLNLYSGSLSDPKLWLRYSRDENFYASSNRYLTSGFSYSALVTKVVPGLTRLKIIRDQKGFYDRREFGDAFQARMKPTAKLLQLFQDHQWQPSMMFHSPDREVIHLKNSDKKYVSYKDDDFTRNAREQLQHINRHLEAAVIDVDLDDGQIETLYGYLRKSHEDDFDDHSKYLSFFTRKTLYRIFSNSSWKQHGRFYGGFWMSLPERHKTKENGEFVITSLRYRDSISINHQITTELDYSSFHPKMIYDLEGLDLPGDPYEGIGDLDRDHGKTIFNIMINAKDKEKAQAAYMQDYQDENVTKAASKEAIECVLEVHPLIRKHFFTGLGLKLMNFDSQIANNVMLRSIDEHGTVVLPVHDSFICILDFEEDLKKIMREEYMTVMNAHVPPRISMKESEWYLPIEARGNIKKLNEMNLPKSSQRTYPWRRQQLIKMAMNAREKYEIQFNDDIGD